MGTRGPIPDPKSGRSQTGRNTRHRKTPGVAAGEITPPQSVAARPAAARFWDIHADALAADGRLGLVQVEAFGILCHLYADCEQLAEQLAAEGWITATEKGQSASPVAKLLRDSRRDFVALARDFGLTASSAARIPQEPPDGEEADTLKAFIDGTA
jgi:phage terminase small subunit